MSASSSKVGFREIWGSKWSVFSVSVQISLLYFSGPHLVAVRLVLNCMCPATSGDDQLLQLPSSLFYFAPVPWVENQASNSPLPHTLSRIIKNISWPHDLYNHCHCRMVVKRHSHLISQNLALHLHCVIIWIIVMLLNHRITSIPRNLSFHSSNLCSIVSQNYNLMFCVLGSILASITISFRVPVWIKWHIQTE